MCLPRCPPASRPRACGTAAVTSSSYLLLSSSPSLHLYSLPCSCCCWPEKESMRTGSTSFRCLGAWHCATCWVPLISKPSLIQPLPFTLTPSFADSCICGFIPSWETLYFCTYFKSQVHSITSHLFNKHFLRFISYKTSIFPGVLETSPEGPIILV